jgi:quercetin dioxygenase-like cupin family protein
MEMTMKGSTLIVGLVVLVGITAGVAAQQSGAPRTILQRLDSSIPGREAIASVADFQAGASTGWHTHPGDMVGYVLQGSLTIEIEGQPTVTHGVGQTVIIPAGVPHSDTASADGAARMLASYFVVKGQPLNTPATRR